MKKRILIKNDNVYDALKEIAETWLPAAGVLYFTLATIWGLPYAAAIEASIAAIDVALAKVLHLSHENYVEGTQYTTKADSEDMEG